MKSLRLAGCLLIAFIALGSSCSDSESKKEQAHTSPRIVKTTKLTLPKANQEFILGEAVSFEIEAGESVLDSVIVELGSLALAMKGKQFDLPFPNAKTGFNRVRVSVYCNGQKEIHARKIKFLSDIKPTSFAYEVVNTYPHDRNAFTQGLFFKEDTLIESTGRNGESWMAKVNLKTGHKFQQKNLDAKYFGEGSCLWNNQYIQLTYTSGTGLVYDLNFNEVKRFSYHHQGWGITTWGDTLLISDGSNIIHKVDPRDFSEFDRLEVYDHKRSVNNLNELEMVEGLLYANIWMTDRIVVIDPQTGKVLENLDLRGLQPEKNSGDNVLNGIAYNSKNQKLYVTGKLWPELYEIRKKPI